MSFVLLILFYKFYSHNRLAGYCKLLNHERHSMDETKDETKSKDGESISLFAWEICIERLRASDISPKALLDLLDRIKIKDIEITTSKFLIR